MSVLKWINVAFRGIMEAGIVAALAYWGYHLGEGRLMSIILAIGAPVIGFGFWGLVDFNRAGKAGEWLRLMQELIISGFAAWELYSAGRHLLGLILGLLSVLHHILVYLLGGRLLESGDQS